MDNIHFNCENEVYKRNSGFICSSILPEFIQSILDSG